MAEKSPTAGQRWVTGTVPGTYDKGSNDKGSNESCWVRGTVPGTYDVQSPKAPSAS